MFDQFSTVKPGSLTSPGSSVTFLFYGDLTATTTVLSETVDIDAVALSDSLVTVTPQERGNAVLTTLKVRTDSFANGFNSNVAQLIGWNMVDSLETVAQEVYSAAGQTTWTNGLTADATIQATNIVTMNSIRANIADLRGDNVMGYAGGDFIVLMHPDVEYDLMAATNESGWVQFSIRQDGQAWYQGQVARAAGASFVSSPRALLTANGGSSTVDKYTTYIFGDQAIAKAESIPPHIVAGPVTDTLMRFIPLGWYAYLAWGQFRSAAMNRLHAASSIGAN